MALGDGNQAQLFIEIKLLQVVSMWLWLSQRFEPQMFPGRAEAEELSQKLIEQMEGALESMYTNATSDVPLQQPARKRSAPLVSQHMISSCPLKQATGLSF